MLLTATLLSMLQAAAAADSLPGTWQIQGDVEGNPLSEVCTIQQTEAALTGSCTAAGGPIYEITGEVKDGTITFRHGGEYDGQPLTIIYSGTLTSPEEIRGTVEVQPFQVTGWFSAKPVEEAEAPLQP